MYEIKPRSPEQEDGKLGFDQGSDAPRSGPSDFSSLYPCDSQAWVELSIGSAMEVRPTSSDPTETLNHMVHGSDGPEEIASSSSVDMVRQLLAERDRDLELAARIGQSLLQRNHQLQEHNEEVEEQLAQALDQVRQIQHELGKKDELLRFATSAEESDAPPSSQTVQPRCLPLETRIALSQLENLQALIQEQEEENRVLCYRASHLKTETMKYEEKEQKLVQDCMEELRECSNQVVFLTDELTQKSEELVHHQEEITLLLSQIMELQHRVKQLALEKEELKSDLLTSKSSQRQLTTEMNELQDRNAECFGMLQETQQEIKELRNKNMLYSGLSNTFTQGLFRNDSLAAEIEGFTLSEYSEEEQSAIQDQRNSHVRIFETVRSVNNTMQALSGFLPIPGGVVMTTQPSNSSHTELSYASQMQFFQAEHEQKLQGLISSAACGEGSGYCFANSSTSDLSASSGSHKLQIIKPIEGSLTLHHWQQLAQPHLATVLDPHPGVVTKGFHSLPQDQVYYLTDLEEDDDKEEDNHCWRFWEMLGKNEVRQDMEEVNGRITFQVQSTSTPEVKRMMERTSASLPTASSMPFSSLQPSAQGFSCETSSAHHPGRCQSTTSSTFTFTNCRILHPCNITQITCSSSCRPPETSQRNISSSLHTGPSTPITCHFSQSEGLTAAPRGLAELLQKRGISAQQVPISATPPNSPRHSPVPFDPQTYLPSRPNMLYLQDVYGIKLAGTGEPRAHPEVVHSNIGLVERLHQLGFDPVPRQAGGIGQHCQDSATLLALGSGSLLDSLRRNQSVPALIGGRGPSLNCFSLPTQTQPGSNPSQHPDTS